MNAIAERTFKARVGLDATETPREHAFCAYTIVGNETFIVEDATADERFANNPLLTSDPHIRFCAGSPLIDRYGNALGSRCVMDRKPRRLSAEQRLRSGGTFTRHHRLPRITTGFRWAADAAHILDARRPGNDQAFARAVALGGVAGCGGENV